MNTINDFDSISHIKLRDASNDYELWFMNSYLFVFKRKKIGYCSAV